LDRRLGEPQSRSGCGGEERNSQPPPGIEPQNYTDSYHGSVDVIVKREIPAPSRN